MRYPRLNMNNLDRLVALSADLRVIHERVKEMRTATNALAGERAAIVEQLVTIGLSSAQVSDLLGDVGPSGVRRWLSESARRQAAIEAEAPANDWELLHGVEGATPPRPRDPRKTRDTHDFARLIGARPCPCRQCSDHRRKGYKSRNLTPEQIAKEESAVMSAYEHAARTWAYTMLAEVVSKMDAITPPSSGE